MEVFCWQTRRSFAWTSFHSRRTQTCPGGPCALARTAHPTTYARYVSYKFALGQKFRRQERYSRVLSLSTPAPMPRKSTSRGEYRIAPCTLLVEKLPCGGTSPRRLTTFSTTTTTMTQSRAIETRSSCKHTPFRVLNAERESHFPFETLFSEIQETTNYGCRSGALRSLPTTHTGMFDRVTGIYMELRVLAMKEEDLQMKPDGFAQETDSKSDDVKNRDFRPKEADPFSPPYDPGLLVADRVRVLRCDAPLLVTKRTKSNLEGGTGPLEVLQGMDQAFREDDKGTEFAILLNKFNVLPHHILLVSRQWASQNSLLTKEDFHLWYSVVSATSPSFIGFHNCGKGAGASQPHKHMQVVPVEGTKEKTVRLGNLHLPLLTPIDTVVYRAWDSTLHTISSRGVRSVREQAMSGTSTARSLGHANEYNDVDTLQFPMFCVPQFSFKHRVIGLIPLSRTRDEDGSQRDTYPNVKCIDGERLTQLYKEMLRDLFDTDPTNVESRNESSDASDVKDNQKTCAGIDRADSPRPFPLTVAVKAGVDWSSFGIKYPHNILLTRHYLMVVPRSKEAVDGVPINGLNYFGKFFLFNETQKEILQKLVSGDINYSDEGKGGMPQPQYNGEQQGLFQCSAGRILSEAGIS